MLNREAVFLSCSGSLPYNFMVSKHCDRITASVCLPLGSFRSAGADVEALKDC
jgi:hypothetical protein